MKGPRPVGGLVAAPPVEDEVEAGVVYGLGVGLEVLEHEALGEVRKVRAHEAGALEAEGVEVVEAAVVGGVEAGELVHGEGLGGGLDGGSDFVGVPLERESAVLRRRGAARGERVARELQGRGRTRGFRDAQEAPERHQERRGVGAAVEEGGQVGVGGAGGDEEVSQAPHDRLARVVVVVVVALAQVPDGGADAVERGAQRLGVPRGGGRLGVEDGGDERGRRERGSVEPAIQLFLLRHGEEPPEQRPVRVVGHHVCEGELLGAVDSLRGVLEQRRESGREAGVARLAPSVRGRDEGELRALRLERRFSVREGDVVPGDGVAQPPEGGRGERRHGPG
mmetsp:Transcript_9477/g.30256  ORF Transcript_9477/g.30256 Transcript_9477/m.30256 type:complete len:337 (-) Transcript_9477:1486-2496(-)